MTGIATAGGAGGRIAVIVVNYGTADLAIAAVDSVLRQSHGGRPVEIHLVDNASPGEDAARLAAAMAQPGRAGRVILYPETENHGFGRGNNVVLRALDRRPDPPEYVFLLNPDACLQNDAIAHLAAFLDAHPRAGFAGAAICNADGRPVTAAFRLPTVAGTFLEQANFGPVTGLLRQWQIPLPPGGGTARVGWVAGAAVMARFAVLRQLGGFHDGFFLYFEEVDLMQRAQRAGWQTWWVADAKVLHVEGAATEVNSHVNFRKRRPLYFYQSWSLYLMRSRSRAVVQATVVAALAGALVNLASARLLRRDPYIPQSFLPDFWGVVGRPAFGLRARAPD